MKKCKFTIKYKKTSVAFTLIETLVAILILTVSVVAPLSLASQSLFASYYAKDQVIASYLAQEGIEIVRQKRDHNLITLLRLPDPDRNDWLSGMQIPPTGSVDVILDIKNPTADFNKMVDVSDAVLKYDGHLYFHSNVSSAPNSKFRRIVHLKKISNDEIEVKAEVRWKTGSFPEQKFSIKENLYNWLPVGL